MVVAVAVAVVVAVAVAPVVAVADESLSPLWSALAKPSVKG